MREKYVYQLWIEYLKRSEPYRLFCERWIAQEPNYIQYYNSGYFEPFHLNFDRFGNIHHPEWSFDEWYESALNRRPIGPLPKACVISEEEDQRNQIFGRSGFDFEGSAVLRVSIDCRFSLEEIEAEVRRMVQGFRKGAAAFLTWKRVNGFDVEEGKRAREEFWRYLEVYDLKERHGLKINEIISRMATPAQKAADKDTNRRIYQRYLEKARNIIRNVENGVFPGRDY